MLPIVKNKSSVNCQIFCNSELIFFTFLLTVVYTVGKHS